VAAVRSGFGGYLRDIEIDAIQDSPRSKLNGVDLGACGPLIKELWV